MAYDIARRRTVLFGGYTLEYQARVLADTWEWDGDTWTQRNPGVSPPPLGEAAMSYDLARQRVVLFGGASSYGWNADTWEWDGATWTKPVPIVSPQIRSRHAMAYDVVRRRTVLFGGLGNLTSPLNDTWEWDGVSWILQSPASSPSPRSLHAMAYDLARRRVVLHGGVNSTSELWEWDGTQWTSHVANPAPPLRSRHAIAYDVARAKSIVFGGDNGGPGGRPLADTWQWDGSNWFLLAAPVAPGTSDSPALAYDSARDRVILFDGQTWEWGGQRWMLQSPSSSPGVLGPLAFDSARQRTVLFGRGETWEWDGNAWVRRAPTLSPPARTGHVMTYDSARQRVVMFGGSDASGFLTDTWEWDGTTWLARPSPTHPVGRNNPGMVYDEFRQRTVFYGGWFGTTGYSDTWEWDGNAWLRRQTASALGARAFFAMCYDKARRRSVVHGGLVPFSLYPNSDTWTWDGFAWQRETPRDEPLARNGHAMVYDDALQCPILFAGRSYWHPLADLWCYSGAESGTQTVGTGCSSSSAAPLLTSTAPMLGSAPLRLELLQARPVAAYLIGLSAGTQSLPIAACTLYLRDPIVPLFGITNWAGVASAPGLALPSDPALRGVPFYAQGFVADPQGPALGMTFTAGLTLRLGD